MLIGKQKDTLLVQFRVGQSNLDLTFGQNEQHIEAFVKRAWQHYPNEPAPGGMTLWFFPRDGRKSYSMTTSEVRHYETYLSKGDYDGLVIDYSPAEYGHQEFTGMDYAQTAKVQSTPASYQPDTLTQLYGPDSYARALPSVEPTGLYTLFREPENMASDTIHLHIDTGLYDEYIPYRERHRYQQTLVHRLYHMEPHIIPWRMRVRVYIRGVYYLYQTKGSIAGLADGYYLMQDRTSETPCLLALDDWETVVTGDNVGYVAMTFKTWGPTGISVRQHPETLNGGKAEGVPDVFSDRPADDVRLNLRFLLRDRRTVCSYHFDVGNLIRAYWNEYALRIDLEDGFDGQPVLPYVDAYNGLGFDGLVVPWEKGGDSDVTF